MCLSHTAGSHANPDSQQYVRKMFSISSVPQQMEHHTSNFFFKISIILFNLLHRWFLGLSCHLLPLFRLCHKPKDHLLQEATIMYVVRIE